MTYNDKNFWYADGWKEKEAYQLSFACPQDVIPHQGTVFKVQAYNCVAVKYGFSYPFTNREGEGVKLDYYWFDTEKEADQALRDRKGER